MISKNNNRAVIFDMDGVILNSEPIHYQVNQKIFSKLGVVLNDEEYDSLVGTSLPEMWQDLKKRFSISSDVEELVDFHRERIRKLFLDLNIIQPIEGIVELIKSLRRSDHLTAIASSTSFNIIELILKKMEIHDLFDVITGGDQVMKGKPDPEIFLQTATSLGCETDNCLVIEDSQNGVRAAKTAGMKCVGFRNPSSGDQDLSCADMIIIDFKELNPAKIKDLYDQQ